MGNTTIKFLNLKTTPKTIHWTKLTKTGNASLLKAVGFAFKVELIQLGLVQLSVHGIKSLGTPFFLGQFLLYFRKGSDVPYDLAVAYAIGLIFSIGYVVIVGNSIQAIAQQLGMRIRIAICSLIYRKTLRLSRSALSDTNPGQVINLISNDIARFENVPLNIHLLWVSPLTSTLIVYFLCSVAGWGSCVGILYLVLMAPIQSYFGKLTAKYRYEISIKTDERIRLMDELISGCQVIKMYAWEKSFAKLIQIVRKSELKWVRKAVLLRAIFLSLIFSNYRIAIFTTVVTLVLMNGTITASAIYSIFALYVALSAQITKHFYNAITDVSEMWVAHKRLQKYLEYDEMHAGVEQKSNKTVKLLSSSNYAISINNGMTRWNDGGITNKANIEAGAFELKNINIQFEKGILIGIIGPVGCGKTSLLQTILHELPLISGSIVVDGNISYAAQEPWVFGGTVRQNILFGQKMDKLRYDKTIKACALLDDFKQFPQGDNSLVGDKGAALSGGQKARINLARAIYREADIYLLDDPLSAVDAHVGRFLFNTVIGPESYLAAVNSTRILATHQVHFLSKADWIISLKDGAIEFQGTVSDLCQSDLNVAQLFNANETDEYVHKTVEVPRLLLNNESNFTEEVKEIPAQQNVEQSSKGKIEGSIVGNFIKCGATKFRFFLFVVLFLCGTLFATLNDLWLSYFISREELRVLLHTDNYTAQSNFEEDNLWSSVEYLYVYIALIIGLILVLAVRTGVTSNTMTNLSQGLHDRMFNGVISSPLRFFDTNPTGRILNRFSKDMGNVDELLPRALFDAVQTVMYIPIIVILTIATYPLLAIPVTIMVILFLGLTRITLKTSNDVKRIEGITRSPVYSHMTSSITGLSTIRAFTAEKILIGEFDSYQDIHSSAFFMYIYTSTAFGFALEMISFISISTIIITTLLLESMDLEGNKIGLIITQSLILHDVVNLCSKQFAAVCNIMMGVERLLEYNILPQEKQPDVPSEMSDTWPPQGKLEFKNVYYRYFKEGNPVLIDINMLIRAGEKIGIVGRTGAGKSSLIGTIFRLAEIDGKIFIDDVDTATILLKDLRTKLSIIPQDPVLFSGTLRRNLDPFEEFEDDNLWKVLEEVELKDTILTAGLETTVSTGGSNFSVGQRQLLCLARALLRNNKILILDEATANVDPETDILIQQTIREKFKQCTILTIAHRLHTIMDSDRVLVMNFGKIVEFAAPFELLQNTNGVFKEMVEATGETESERLKIQSLSANTVTQ